MLRLVDYLGITNRWGGVDLTLCLGFTAGQDDLGIDVQGGGNAAWRPEGARKRIVEGVVAIVWSMQDRLEGWLIADKASEPIR